MLVWFFRDMGWVFFPCSCFEFWKTFASHLSSEYSKVTFKVDYLQQLFGTEAGACLFFLKSEQMQVPPPLVFLCQKWSFFSCSLSSLFCRVSRSRTQVTPNDLVLLGIAILFLHERFLVLYMIYIMTLLAWLRFLWPVLNLSSLGDLFHYFYLFPVFLPCLALYICKTFDYYNKCIFANP